MARRQGSRRTALTLLGPALALSTLASACSPELTVEDTASLGTVAQPGSTSTTATSTTTTSPTTTSTVETTTSLTTTTDPDAPGPPVGTLVRVPNGEGPFPAIVLVHGGGWIVGTPESMEPLADYLTAEGFLTVNVAYQLSLRSPGFPDAIEDVVCGVAHAAAHEDSDGTVAIIGHSAGAHIGAIAALNPEGFDDRCPVPEISERRFVGLAGPYDTNRLGRVMVPFFGGDQSEIPQIWDSGNPHLLVGSHQTLKALLIHGDADPVIPIDFSRHFTETLLGGGVAAELAELAGSDHPDARDPAVVGSLIVDWITDA